MFKYVIDRTVYFDIVIQEYLAQHPQCKQIVILGSGMDSRAYRMGLSGDMKIFEVDYAHVHDYKTAILKGISFSTQFIFYQLIAYLKMTSLAANV
jgi:O-methyltransferase involved in polyketide biosynthesis